MSSDDQPAEIPLGLQSHFKNIEDEAIEANMLRKSSCETQWSMIKNKFLSLRDSGKNVVKLTVQNEMSIARQIRRSDQHLSELLRDGAELITNVRIANDQREVERRNADIAERQTLYADLRAESALATSKLNAINQRWGQLDHFKEPMGLYDGLNLQKSRIADIMAQKDDLIAELHEALFRSDEQYQLDQTTKLNDLQCLVDRIDCQVDVMKRAYRSHLDILQTTVGMERMQFKTSESNRWDKLYNELQTKEGDSETQNNLTTLRYDEEMAKLCTTHQELNRATMIRLDRDNDRLQVELQNVKTDVLLNTEKLTYNFKVLQKRASENVIVKAQQKRRLARLNEVVLKVREKYGRLKRETEEESGRLSREVLKLYSNLVSFGGKSESLNSASCQQYLNVWDVHESECVTLLQSILGMSEEIGTKYLDQPSSPNNEIALIVSKIQQSRPYQKRDRIPSARQLSERSRCATPLDQHTIKYVLEQLVDLTTWLQDDDIKKIFSGVEHLDEYTLVQVDQILSCFGITNMDHLMSLVELFVPNPLCDASNDSTDCIAKSSDVTKADASTFCDKLRQFIENFGHTSNFKPSLTSPNINEVQPHQVAQYWKSFIHEVPSNQDRLWTNLEKGMTKYLQVLKRRSKLDEECEFLRKQNSELKFLLLRYLPQNEQKE